LRVGDADTLWQDLGKDQHRECQHARENANREFVKQLGRQPADHHRAKRIRNGVQGEDRRDRAVELVPDSI